MSIFLNSVIIGKAENPKIILLHGWKHHIEMIRPLGELLSDHFQVHIIDLPGHGKSEIPNESWGMKEFADCILSYLNQQQIKQAIFIGHSFGGKTIIKLSSLYPQRVLKIVLINSSGLQRKYSLDQRIKIFTVRQIRNFLKLIKAKFNVNWYETWFIPRFASTDYKNAGPMLGSFVKTVNEDLTEDLKKIKNPTLLLWSEKDTETPLELGKRMQELIPESKLIILNDQHHTPFNSAGASLCAYYIGEFLNQ